MDKIKAWLSDFNAKLKMDLADIWNKDKAFLFIFGLLILIVKFKDLWIDLLLNSSKKVENKANQEDGSLASKENQAEQESDDLVKKSEETKDQPVNDDWYEK